MECYLRLFIFGVKMRSVALARWAGLKRFFPLGVSPLVIFLAAGCGDSEVKTYRVAKEEGAPPVASQPAAPEGHDHAGHGMQGAVALPKLSWTTPTGWKEMGPDGMRKAAFEVSGEAGKVAKVMVIPLPGASNIELESVNMWREELGLQPLNKDQVTTQGQAVEVGDAKGRLFEMVSEAPKGEQKFNLRTVGAIAERQGVLWFVKMTGAEDLVAQQKPTFVTFLGSIKFEGGGAEAPAGAGAVTTAASATRLPAADGPKGQVPANWQQKAPGPMVTTAYGVSGPDGAADITVIKLPGAAGGLVGNVNRWRGQLGLPPLPDDEAKKSAEMLEINGNKDSYLIDVKGMNARSGKPARMVAVAVARGAETWFYKLLGDDAAVGKEKDAFLKFIVNAN